MLSVVAVLIAWIAFKRGHNGYVMVLAVLGSAGIGMALGALTQWEAIFPSMLGVSCVLALLYCFVVPGNGTDQLQEIDDHHQAALENTEALEETKITEEDLVVLKVYTYSWQQSELMDDLEKLRDNGVWHQPHSGPMASVSVRAGDFDHAAEVIGLAES